MKVAARMKLNLGEKPAVKALIQDQAKSPADFRPDICEDDEMYLFSLSNLDDNADRALVRYYSLGRRILDCVKQVVEWHFGSFDQVSSFLDFACGYGRFTRFLIQEMPATQIWSSDIYANAVKFQQDYLGVNGIVSTTNPEDYSTTQPFDCILANSFFSHMPERTFTPWLQKLYDVLTPGGLLMFTVHDEALLPAHIQMEPSGILFSADSESRSLDKEEYGTTYVSETFVREIIHQVSGGQASAHRIPRGMCGFQDLYLVTNQPDQDFSSLRFSHHPQGYVDVAYVTPAGDLQLKGWAADFNPGGKIAEIQVLINGEQVKQLQPSQERSDVAQYFGTENALTSGWSCQLEKGTFSSQDIVVIKAINQSQLQWLIEVSTLEPLLRQKHGELHEEMKRVQSQLRETKAELETTQNHLATTQTALEKTQAELATHQAQLEQMKEQLLATQTQLVFAQSEQEQTHSYLVATQDALAQSRSRISAMESSKFWQLRKAWFRVKRLAGSGENE